MTATGVSALARLGGRMTLKQIGEAMNPQRSHWTVKRLAVLHGVPIEYIGKTPTLDPERFVSALLGEPRKRPRGRPPLLINHDSAASAG